MFLIQASTSHYDSTVLHQINRDTQKLYGHEFTMNPKELVIHENEEALILISNFRCMLNAVLCLSGNLPASELLVPTFQNLLAVPSS